MSAKCDMKRIKRILPNKKPAKEKQNNAESCVCCGEIIPEGYGTTCYACKKRYGL